MDRIDGDGGEIALDENVEIVSGLVNSTELLNLEMDEDGIGYREMNSILLQINNVSQLIQSQIIYRSILVLSSQIHNILKKVDDTNNDINVELLNRQLYFFLHGSVEPSTDNEILIKTITSLFKLINIPMIPTICFIRSTIISVIKEYSQGLTFAILSSEVFKKWLQLETKLVNKDYSLEHFNTESNKLKDKDDNVINETNKRIKNADNSEKSTIIKSLSNYSAANGEKKVFIISEIPVNPGAQTYIWNLQLNSPFINTMNLQNDNYGLDMFIHVRYMTEKNSILPLIPINSTINVNTDFKQLINMMDPNIKDILLNKYPGFAKLSFLYNYIQYSLINKDFDLATFCFYLNREIHFVSENLQGNSNLSMLRNTSNRTLLKSQQSFIPISRFFPSENLIHILNLPRDIPLLRSRFNHVPNKGILKGFNSTNYDWQNIPDMEKARGFTILKQQLNNTQSQTKSTQRYDTEIEEILFNTQNEPINDISSYCMGDYVINGTIGNILMTKLRTIEDCSNVILKIQKIGDIENCHYNKGTTQVPIYVSQYFIPNHHFLHNMYNSLDISKSKRSHILRTLKADITNLSQKDLLKEGYTLCATYQNSTQNNSFKLVQALCNADRDGIFYLRGDNTRIASLLNTGDYICIWRGLITNLENNEITSNSSQAVYNTQKSFKRSHLSFNVEYSSSTILMLLPNSEARKLVIAHSMTDVEDGNDISENFIQNVSFDGFSTVASTQYNITSQSQANLLASTEFLSTSLNSKMKDIIQDIQMKFEKNALTNLVVSSNINRDWDNLLLHSNIDSVDDIVDMRSFTSVFKEKLSSNSNFIKTISNNVLYSFTSSSSDSTINSKFNNSISMDSIMHNKQLDLWNNKLYDFEKLNKDIAKYNNPLYLFSKAISKEIFNFSNINAICNYFESSCINILPSQVSLTICGYVESIIPVKWLINKGLIKKDSLFYENYTDDSIIIKLSDEKGYCNIILNGVSKFLQSTKIKLDTLKLEYILDEHNMNNDEVYNLQDIDNFDILLNDISINRKGFISNLESSLHDKLNNSNDYFANSSFLMPSDMSKDVLASEVLKKETTDTGINDTHDEFDDEFDDGDDFGFDIDNDNMFKAAQISMDEEINQRIIALELESSWLGDNKISIGQLINIENLVTIISPRLKFFDDNSQNKEIYGNRYLLDHLNYNNGIGSELELTILGNNELGTKISAINETSGLLKSSLFKQTMTIEDINQAFESAVLSKESTDQSGNNHENSVLLSKSLIVRGRCLFIKKIKIDWETKYIEATSNTFTKEINGLINALFVHDNTGLLPILCSDSTLPQECLLSRIALSVTIPLNHSSNAFGIASNIVLE